MKILISPYSRVLKDKENPKNYPYFEDLIKILKSKGHYVIQVGTKGEKEISGVNELKFNLPLEKLKEEILECDFWISIDNFFQHFASYYGKKGIVIFSVTSPTVYGYKENINILKDEKYLAKNQFMIMESIPFDYEAFVKPEEIIKYANL